MIDFDRIIEALLEEDISPTARTLAAPLLESWIEEFGEQDSRSRTVAVECGFHIWLDANTLVIGVQDRVAEGRPEPLPLSLTDTDEFVYGCEWKSAKEPQQNKDGSDSAWWNEGVWASELKEGPQLAIYALAMKRGIYFSRDVDGPFRLDLKGKPPRILVRAAVKSNPPRFWPSDRRQALKQFTPQALVAVERALLAKAAMIRALREQPYTPWQLPGKHCTEFRRQCQFYGNCTEHHFPEIDARNVFFNPHDPAAQLALPFIPKEALENDRLVILSASSYQLATSCMEKFRVISGASGDKDRSLALEVGTALHAGLASLYRMQMEEQSAT